MFNNLVGHDAARVQSFPGHLLSDGRDSMIGRKRNDVISPPHGAVQMAQQTPDRGIEPHQHILHLVAARPEVVADKIER